MVTTTIPKMENVWNTVQEPRCTACPPNSYMLLLSALDQGWKVIKVELVPSWDQYGFIYYVTLKHSPLQHTQNLILPQNSLVSHLLQEYGPKVASTPSREYQPA